MNIHINKEQFDELKKGTILSIKMGSALYGAQVASSDTDYLHIFAHNEKWENSFVWTHHNFQYKEDNVDHVFVSLKNFVRNLVKGDSTINFECLFSEEMQNSSELSFLCDFKNDFNSYSVVRAYLGLVRRDLKIFSQSYECKKLYHAVRGLNAALKILNNSYTNNLSLDKELFSFLMKIRRNEFDRKEMIDIMKKTSDECSNLRTKVSDDFTAKKMNRLMDVTRMKCLDEKIIFACSTKWYKEKMNHNFSCDAIYDILENDITYE